MMIRSHRAAWRLGLLGIGGVLLVFAAILRQRAANYHYDVTRDAHYDFGRAALSRSVGALQNGRLVVPPKPHATDALFAAVRVQSTLLGRWFEPRVEIDSGRETFTQAIERGGSGLRYINLSALDLPVETSIRLVGKHLDIDDQQVELLYVRNDFDPKQQTLLVLSPHPDDAEIAAFGLYAGHDAYVVTVTAGEAENAGLFLTYQGADPYVEMARIRVWNSLAVPMLGDLSPERTANLGYFDSTLQAMRATPGSAVHSITTPADSLDAFRRSQAADLIPPRPHASATWANLVEDLQYLIEHIRPDIIVAPYPLLDAHPDHKMTTFALIEALKNLNWTRGSLLLYTNHLPDSPIYPYGNAGDLVSLPPKNAAVTFDGILSNSLTSEEQTRKYEALDAMVDLQDYLGAVTLWRASKLLARTVMRTIVGSDDSYFRRAVRANELFFLVHVSSLYEPGVTERIEGTAPQPP
jgi:LmbE family N-acetylglucosaminyl deacetylase